MARIRSVKPEFWSDEDLADLPRDGRLLYIGMWNLADEHGRLRGDPRYVKGQLFPYDDDLSAAGVEVLLNALGVAGKVVRYRVAGKQYLFLPNLHKHQRLEADKVPSRLPRPDEADPDPAPPAPSPADPDPPSPGAHVSASRADKSAPGARQDALLYVAGSMEQVAGVPPSAGATAPRVDEPATTQALVAEWLEHCKKRPPANVIGQVSKQIKAMLDEGIDPVDVRLGLAAWHSKGIHPSALPSVVNEVMNSSPRASPINRSSRASGANRHVDELTQEERNRKNPFTPAVRASQIGASP